MPSEASSQSAAWPLPRTQPPPPWLYHLAFTVLGISSFLLSNAFWSEMAALIEVLPEKDRLATWMLFVLQSANIVPAICMLEGPHLKWLRLESVIWVLLGGGFIVCQLMSFFWDATTAVGEQKQEKYSLSLFLLVFAAGCINNSSSLALYPFVAKWERKYISSLATGEGLSGVLVSFLALAQNVGGGEHKHFSVWAFFQIISTVYIFTCVAYLFLLRQQKRLNTPAAPSAAPGATAFRTTTATAAYKRALLLDEEHDSLVLPLAASPLEIPLPLPPPSAAARSVAKILQVIWPFLFVQFCVSGLAYGVLPAVLPVACTPYRDGSHVLQYSSLLSMCMDPTSRFLTHRLRIYRLPLLFMFVNVAAALVITAAAMAPRPPFVESHMGGLFVILSNGAFTFFFAFTSTMVYLMIHNALALSSPLPALPANQRDEVRLEVEMEGERSNGTMASASASAALPAAAEAATAAEAEDGRDGGHVSCDGGGRSSSSPSPQDTQQQQQQFEQQVRDWQDGFKWSSFVIQGGAFVGSIITFFSLK